MDTQHYVEIKDFLLEKFSEVKCEPITEVWLRVIGIHIEIHIVMRSNTRSMVKYVTKRYKKLFRRNKKYILYIHENGFNSSKYDKLFYRTIEGFCD